MPQSHSRSATMVAFQAITGKCIGLFLALAVCLCCPLTVTLAAPNNATSVDQTVFDVEKVEVHAEEDNLDEAKYQALEQGARTAAAELFKRLIPYSLQNRIPDALRYFNSEKWVSGYDTISERMTSDSYNATVNVHFNPKQIQLALIKSGIRFGKKWGPRTLVVPHMPGNIALNSQWFDGWGLIPNTVGLTRIITPLADLADLPMLKKLQPTSAYSSIQNLLERYDCSELVIAIGIQKGATLTVEYTKITADETSQHTLTYQQDDEQSPSDLYYAAAYDITRKMDSELKGFPQW